MAKRIKIPIIYENTTNQKLLKEGVMDALSTLKEYRKKHETPQAKEFFHEVRLIANKAEKNLIEIIPIFDKHYKDTITLSNEYKQLVIQYAKTVYAQFYEKLTLNLKIMQTASLKRDTFLFTTCFIYTALIMNDESKVRKIYEDFQNKIESFDGKNKIASVGWFIGFVPFIITIIKTETLNSDTIYIGSLIFFVASLFLILIHNMIYYFNRKNIRKTGDVLK